MWREENRRTRRKSFEAQERTNKLNSHMMPGPGIEPGTIVVRGERSHRCVTCVPLFPLVYEDLTYKGDMGLILFSKTRLANRFSPDHLVNEEDEKTCLKLVSKLGSP